MNIEEMQAQRDADYETYKAEGRIWGTVPREKIVQIQIPRTSKEVIDRYYALEDMSTAVSDILDTYGIHGAVPNTCLKPVKAGSRLVGTAVTVRSIPSRKTATQGQRDKDKILMSTKDIFYLGEAGDVLVSDFGGNLEYSNIGGQSCHLAKVRGFAGCIAYGAAAIRRRSAEWISRSFLRRDADDRKIPHGVCRSERTGQPLRLPCHAGRSDRGRRLRCLHRSE